MKKFLKNNKGLTGADALLAVALIVLFSGIIATISYNIYIATSSLKRSSKATEYITNVFEHAKKEYYDDVTEEKLVEYFNTNFKDKKTEAFVSNDEQLNTSDKPYIIKISVTSYNATENNEEKLDLVKEIEVNVKYKLGNKTKDINMKTAKARETLETPNKPDLSQITTSQGEYVYPIKYANNRWQVVSDDTNWYNYENGVWASVLIAKTQKQIGDSVAEEDGTIKLWIPRFAYLSSDDSSVEFLYKNTNKKIEVKNEITEIKEKTTGSIVNDESFNPASGSLTGIWVTKEDLTSQPYSILNESKYKLTTDIYNNLW